MEKELNYEIINKIKKFHLPRYEELPTVGLYLEQTVTYINEQLQPLGCLEITGSMVSNYVKKGWISRPEKKKYSADQIAHLFSITILKQVVPLENIFRLFQIQEPVYSNQTAYDYFCMELENILFTQFKFKESFEQVGVTSSLEKEMLQSALIAISQIIYLHYCFLSYDQNTTKM